MVRDTTGGSEENNKVPVRTVGVAAQFILHTSRIQARNVTALRSLLIENNIIISNCFQEAGQEISSPLWDPKFRYRVHKNWPLKRIVCQINPSRFLRHCIFSPWLKSPWWGRASSLSRLHVHTHQTHYSW